MIFEVDYTMGEDEEINLTGENFGKLNVHLNRFLQHVRLNFLVSIAHVCLNFLVIVAHVENIIKTDKL